MSRHSRRIGADGEVSFLRKLRSNLEVESDDCPMGHAALFMKRILTEKRKIRLYREYFTLQYTCALYGLSYLPT